MAATQIYHSKVNLLHSKEDKVAIAELKVWKVPKSDHFPEGIKYSLFLVWKENGEVIAGFDNHKPKGHHQHSGNKEDLYEFKGVDSLIEDFWNKVIEEGFVI